MKKMSKKYDVEVGAGFTKQIKAYEPIRCEVRINIKDVEDKEAAYNEGEKFVEEKLMKTLTEIKNNLS